MKSNWYTYTTFEPKNKENINSDISNVNIKLFYDKLHDFNMFWNNILNKIYLDDTFYESYANILKTGNRNVESEILKIINSFESNSIYIRELFTEKDIVTLKMIRVLLIEILYLFKEMQYEIFPDVDWLYLNDLLNELIEQINKWESSDAFIDKDSEISWDILNSIKNENLRIFLWDKELSNDIIWTIWRENKYINNLFYKGVLPEKLEREIKERINLRRFFSDNKINWIQSLTKDEVEIIIACENVWIRENNSEPQIDSLISNIDIIFNKLIKTETQLNDIIKNLYSQKNGEHINDFNDMTSNLSQLLLMLSNNPALTNKYIKVRLTKKQQNKILDLKNDLWRFRDSLYSVDTRFPSHYFPKKFFIIRELINSIYLNM